MSQPPFPPQQPYPPGQLVLNLRKPSGWGSASMMTPQVKIDGFPAPVRWEQNAFPVVPGRHQVEAATTYLWQFGHASLPVDIAPGQSVEVHYSSPLITFMSGRMGFEPQPRPGAVAMWAILAAVVLIIVFVVVVVILGS
jgi:hypothetical protein